MTEFEQAILLAIVSRLALLLVGLLFGYMGYRLFLAGVYEQAGDLEAKWGEKNIMLKRAAPGTFFALFGVAVIIVSIVQQPLIKSFAEKEIRNVNPVRAPMDSTSVPSNRAVEDKREAEDVRKTPAETTPARVGSYRDDGMIFQKESEGLTIRHYFGW